MITLIIVSERHLSAASPRGDPGGFALRLAKGLGHCRRRIDASMAVQAYELA
jgi:hypothetical protein